MKEKSLIKIDELSKLMKVFGIIGDNDDRDEINRLNLLLLKKDMSECLRSIDPFDSNYNTYKHENNKTMEKIIKNYIEENNNNNIIKIIEDVSAKYVDYFVAWAEKFLPVVAKQYVYAQGVIVNKDLIPLTEEEEEDLCRTSDACLHELRSKNLDTHRFVAAIRNACNEARVYAKERISRNYGVDVDINSMNDSIKEIFTR